MDTSVGSLPLPPARVQVGPNSYRLVPCATDDPALEGAEGITDFVNRTIHFAHAHHGARDEFDTIWHELTHAVNDSFGLDVNRLGRRRADEKIAQCHGYAWTQVMLDNPAFVEWLSLATNYVKSALENPQG